MAQNEKKRMASSNENDIQNQDQASQRRETDNQNARSPKPNMPGRNERNERNDSNDRGISGMSAGFMDNNKGQKSSNTGKKRDSMDLNKENTPQ